MKFFSFKQQHTDFVVEEILPFELSWQGEYLYMFIEKQNISTFELIQFITNNSTLRKQDIGIAWLKDKRGVTRQRLCFLRKDIAWFGIKKLLQRKVTVLESSFHDRFLERGMNLWNHFAIKIRNKDIINDQRFDTLVQKILEDSHNYGFLNLFGSQRFGFDGKNRQVGMDILTGQRFHLKGTENTIQEKKFKVQAARSFLFNRYALQREREKTLSTMIPGDVILNTNNQKLTRTQNKKKLTQDHILITGPLFGYDLMTWSFESIENIMNKASEQLPAVQRELKLFADVWLTPSSVSLCQKRKIYGLRRPLVQRAYDVKLQRLTPWMFLLHFFLPKSTYASTFLEHIDRQCMKLYKQI